jgi:hypothetical protein
MENKIKNVILTYGELNNYKDVKLNTELYAMTHFDDLTYAISKNEYFEPEEPKRSDYAIKGLTEEEITIIFTDALKLYFEKLKKFRKDKMKLYGYILTHVSAESRIAIEGDVWYENADREKCPLTLWRIITKTHKGGITSQCKVVNNMKIKRDYLSISADPNMNIVTYHKNFIYLAENYHAIMSLDMKDVDVDNDIAWHFFTSLSDVAHSEFKKDVINRLNNKSMNEKISLTDMFNLARSYTPLTKGAASKPTQVVYAVSKPVSKHADYYGDDSDDEKEYIKVVKKPLKSKETRSKVPRGIETIQCFNCYKLGHYKSDCPTKYAKEADTKEADAKDSGAAIVVPK